MKKMKVAIIYGGKSAEHDVSVLSAKNIYHAIDKTKYTPVFLKILKSGKWAAISQQQFLDDASDKSTAKISDDNIITLAPESRGEVALLTAPRSTSTIDIAFPVLHGSMGEDGTVQGLLKLANIPFVGSSVLGSAIGMDKDVMKRLLKDAGIPIGKFMVLHHGQDVPSFDEVVKVLGAPFFVKPANMGSSVGVARVDNEQEFSKALQEAFLYDVKILMEEYIHGRELECALIGNSEVQASVLGEIKTQHDSFYSYNAKYRDEHGAILEIPAAVPEAISERARSIAIQTYKALMAEGLARVDMFLSDAGDIFINEINTLPGFTASSMYPKLWEASGMSYETLIDTLIQLAIARHNKEQRLITSYSGGDMTCV